MEASGDTAGGTAAPTAVVVGGGISGLLAARELARAGSAPRPGGRPRVGRRVGSHVVAGLTLDSGAESFATRSSAVADLAGELGLAASIVTPNPGGAWVQLPDGPRELPRTGVLGIPADPWDPEVRRSLGLPGSLRASLDKLLPASLGTRAEATSVSALVRTRMGRRVLERLVAPSSAGSTPRTLTSSTSTWWHPDCAPGSGNTDPSRPPSRPTQIPAQWIPAQWGPARGAADRRRRQAPPGLQKAGSAVAGLRGGMHTLVSALLAELRRQGVTLLGGTRADSVERTTGGWRAPPAAPCTTPDSWWSRWKARPPSGCSPAPCRTLRPSAPRPDLTSVSSRSLWISPSSTPSRAAPGSWLRRRARESRPRPSLTPPPNGTGSRTRPAPAPTFSGSPTGAATPGTVSAAARATHRRRAVPGGVGGRLRPAVRSGHRRGRRGLGRCALGRRPALRLTRTQAPGRRGAPASAPKTAPWPSSAAGCPATASRRSLPTPRNRSGTCFPERLRRPPSPDQARRLAAGYPNSRGSANFPRRPPGG